MMESNHEALWFTSGVKSALLGYQQPRTAYINVRTHKYLILTKSRVFSNSAFVTAPLPERKTDISLFMLCAA